MTKRGCLSFVLPQKQTVKWMCLFVNTGMGKSRKMSVKTVTIGHTYRETPANPRLILESTWPELLPWGKRPRTFIKQRCHLMTSPLPALLKDARWGHHLNKGMQMLDPGWWKRVVCGQQADSKSRNDSSWVIHSRATAFCWWHYTFCFFISYHGEAAFALLHYWAPLPVHVSDPASMH